MAKSTDGETDSYILIGNEERDVRMRQKIAAADSCLTADTLASFLLFICSVKPARER